MQLDGTFRRGSPRLTMELPVRGLSQNASCYPECGGRSTWLHLFGALMLLTDSVVQFVMLELIASINHRLSKEYARIELPTPDAMERYVCFHYISAHLKGGARSRLRCLPNHSLLTDARYPHEKFSVLKALTTVLTKFTSCIALRNCTTTGPAPCFDTLRGRQSRKRKEGTNKSQFFYRRCRFQ
jgi:hypothetical protein